jgi:hypothetical protein
VGDERRRIAVVCDLTDAPASAEARIAEFRRLFEGHLIGRSFDDDVVRFRFAAAARGPTFVDGQRGS